MTQDSNDTGITAATLMNPNPKVLHPDDRIISAIELVMEHPTGACPWWITFLSPPP